MPLRVALITSVFSIASHVALAQDIASWAVEMNQNYRIVPEHYLSDRRWL